MELWLILYFALNIVVTAYFLNEVREKIKKKKYSSSIRFAWYIRVVVAGLLIGTPSVVWSFIEGVISEINRFVGFSFWIPFWFGKKFDNIPKKVFDGYMFAIEMDKRNDGLYGFLKRRARNALLKRYKNGRGFDYRLFVPYLGLFCYGGKQDMSNGLMFSLSVLWAFIASLIVLLWFF